MTAPDLSDSIVNSADSAANPRPTRRQKDRAASHLGSANGVGDKDNNVTRSPSNFKQLIFHLSAHDDAGISRLAKSLHEYLDRQTSHIQIHASSEAEYLSDLGHTLATNRTSFPWRTTIQAFDLQSLQDRLATTATGVRISNDSNNVALVFTGQGAQWAGMGRGLAASFPVFAASLADADAYLGTILGSSWSVSAVLEDAALVSKGGIHPLQVALVELLSSWGVKLAAVIGHSSGEVAGAFAADAISREDAWRIAYYRGIVTARLSSSTTEGGETGVGMLSVALSPEAAQEHIDAATSGAKAEGQARHRLLQQPNNVTISGSTKSIAALQARLGDSVFNRKLKVGMPTTRPTCNLWRTSIGN